jgi:hypothetical protein
MDICFGSRNEGEVRFSSVQEGAFEFQDISQFDTITLTTRSMINASGTTGGTIEMWGKEISLADGSVAFIQTVGFPIGAFLPEPGWRYYSNYN